MVEEEKKAFSKRQIDFLNCFAVHRYHEVICNMTEQDLEILHNPGWEKMLDDKQESWEELYNNLMKYHREEAEKTFKALNDYSLLMAHNIAEFTCNEEVYIGSDLMEWICRTFIPFDKPKEDFDWNRYFTAKMENIIKDL